MTTLSEKIQARREAILRMAAQCGVETVRIFSSVARGDAHEGSDVDFLVKMAPRRSLLDVIAFKQDVEDLLGMRVDVVEDEGLSPYLRDRILREARPL